MDVDPVEYAIYTRLKNIYKLFCVGCVIFLIGFFFIFFGRPYTFDQTNKDLFLPFGLLLLIPGIVVTLGAAYLMIKQWKESNDFAKLNRPMVFPEDQVEYGSEYEKQHMVDGDQEQSVSLPGYSQLGLNMNEPI